MKSRLIRLLIIFASYILLFIIAKFVFLATNAELYPDLNLKGIFSILFNGYRMDQSMAAYLTAVPALLMATSIWCYPKLWIDKCMTAWRYISAFLIVLTVALDSVLYSYWQFKLDTTPIFYFLSSPSAAMASVSTWVAVMGTVGVVALGIGAGYALGFLWKIPALSRFYDIRRRLTASATMLLVFGVLFIAIRGGVTVSTMNPSSAYFSTNSRMNHAAVNPMFSLMYSAMHSSDFSKQFRYFDNDSDLSAAIKALNEPDESASDTTFIKLRDGVDKPDVYIIILESFSSHLMPSLGGDSVAMHYDSIAREGVLFDNFYANSFRTDRAIPSILSGYPAQPSTSVMKFVDKAEQLPSISQSLVEKAGYRSVYYYGGDINFVNQKAYLVSSKFETIISDSDFPLNERLSKWGAHDDRLWQRVWADVKNDNDSQPKLTVIQTSSSHEPFEVPFQSHRFDNQRAVAFEYADSCMGAFVDSLKATPRWDRSLLVIVPDHWGAFPKGLIDPVERHKIPLVITGGAVDSSCTGSRIRTVGVQSDIAATLLGLLSVDASEFTMSKNMFDNHSAHYAFFCEPDFAAIISPADTTIISTREDRVIGGDDGNARYVKAFLQNLYNNLDEL